MDDGRRGVRQQVVRLLVGHALLERVVVGDLRLTEDDGTRLDRCRLADRLEELARVEAQILELVAFHQPCLLCARFGPGPLGVIMPDGRLTCSSPSWFEPWASTRVGIRVVWTFCASVALKA